MEPMGQYYTANLKSDTLSYILENDTDLANAKWFIFEHGQDVRYCAEFGKWLKWDGKRWKTTANEEILHLAAQTAERMFNEANAERNKELAQRALRLQNVRKMRAMLELVASDPAILISTDKLDADPWLLNCQNGVIDLRTGELRPHDRGLLLTKITNAAYDPDAECPLWEAFLDRIMAGDKEMIAFIQRAVGYSLTGSTSEQVFFLLHGVGKNGKSTLVSTLSALLADYARATPIATFLSKNNDGIRNDIARLRGARLITAQEADGERRLSEALVKQLTGGDTVVARYLHAEYFEFKLQGKIWLSTNHKPEVRDTSEGFWRRIRLIPFSVVIPEAERDKQLGDKLLAELDGILNWAVQGCLKWQQEGLTPPAAVTEATSEYRKESDILARFIEDKCIVNDQVRVSANELFDTFKTWCDECGEMPPTQTRFGRMMAEKGIQKTKVHGKKWYLGIGLLQ